MREALNNSAVKSIFEKAGTQAAYLDAPEFATLVGKDSALLSAAIKTIGKLE
jgi:hypothetical protein